METKDRDVRRINRRNFLKIGAGAAGALALASCAPKATPTPAPTATPTAPPPPTATLVPTPTPVVSGAKYGGTFTLGMGTDREDWTPYHLAPSLWLLFQAIWSPLVPYKPGTMEPTPGLATSWDINPESTSVVLELRKDVTFHSGREFSAEDVAFSVEARKSTDARDNYGPVTSRVVEVKTLDKHTVRIDFDPPTGPIHSWLETLFVVDRETWLDPERPAGTGPFRLKEYVPGVGSTLVRFEDYWEEGLPFVDSYVTRMIPDRSTLAIAFESKEVDGCWEMEAKDWARWRDDPGYTTHIGSTGYTMTCVFCSMRNEPVTNKKLRQAVAHTIDRERFVKDILHGVGYATDVFLPRTDPAYPADLVGNRAYDLDKARDLVVEAGFGDGVALEVLTSSEFNPAYGPLTEMMVDDMAKVGINATISDLERAAYLSRLRAGDFQITMIGPSRANKGPVMTFAGAKLLWANPDAYMGFYDEEFARLFDELLAEPDSGLQKEMFHRMMEIVQDYCCHIPVAPREWPFAVQNYVKNFEVGDDLEPYVGRLYLDKS